MSQPYGLHMASQPISMVHQNLYCSLLSISCSEACNQHNALHAEHGPSIPCDVLSRFSKGNHLSEGAHHLFWSQLCEIERPGPSPLCFLSHADDCVTGAIHAKWACKVRYVFSSWVALLVAHVCGHENSRRSGLLHLTSRTHMGGFILLAAATAACGFSATAGVRELTTHALTSCDLFKPWQRRQCSLQAGVDAHSSR